MNRPSAVLLVVMFTVGSLLGFFAGQYSRPLQSSSESLGVRSKSEEPPVVLFDFPPTVKKLIINVGSNKDPPVSEDADTAVLAVEPVPETAAKIPRRNNTFIITAAISNRTGFATFFKFNKGAVSSSLSKPASESVKWATDRGVLYVPVLTLRQLLDAVPTDIDIEFLKLDMQSHDFRAVVSAGNAIRRVRELKAEVYCNGFTNYAGAQNDFQRDWIPYMDAMGFDILEPKSEECQTSEKDGIWLRRTRVFAW